MKNKLTVLPIFMILALSQACSNSNTKPPSPIETTAAYHKIDFVNFIDKQKNDTLNFYEELLGDKEFVNVLEHGEYYKEEVNIFLKHGKFTNMQVGVCICAMQNLSVQDYLKLCNIILALFNDNKVPEGLLQDAICPNFLHKRIIIDNYSNTKVMALLKSIENDKKVTNKDFRAWLPDILSGKSSKDLKQFDEDNQSGEY